MKSKISLLLIAFFGVYHFCSAQQLNSLGIKMIRVKSGEFLMGNSKLLPDSILPADNYSELKYLDHGDFDETPVHKVKLTNDFLISATEITVEQYKMFKPEYKSNSASNPYCTGISWNDAVDFCKWISKKEHIEYRLPTEAEWEYVAKNKINNQHLDIENLFSGPAEWCYDWYGYFDESREVNPGGPASGYTKVIKGGGLDRNTAFFLRPENRASMSPNFPPEANTDFRNRIMNGITETDTVSRNNGLEKLKSETLYLNFIRQSQNNQGNHNIGFRVVVSPSTLNTRKANIDFPLDCVKNISTDKQLAFKGPFFRKRDILPTPMDDSPDSLIQYYPAIGLNKGLLSHNHSPALEIMPNGDVLMVIYTSVSETTHDVKLMVSRRRFGSDQWDMPTTLVDCADANDHAPLLWQDKNTTWLFWGNNKYEASFPFQWMCSNDNGQTWTTPQFPIFTSPVYAHSAQPITSAFRDKDGFIYVGSDGVGPSSVLWRSEDNGKTWIDPKGRTNGRHSAFVQMNDGSIMALGGKNSHVNGFMPKAISFDKGSTWEISSTPFIALGSGQRPSMIRLKSGRLLVSGDFSSRLGTFSEKRPSQFTQKGCYVAYSDDEGISWKIKKLPATQPVNDKDDKLNDHTLGYSVLRQSPNGNIHIVATVVHPVLEYEFNENWLLQTDTSVNYSFIGGDDKIISTDFKKELFKSGRVKSSYFLSTTASGKVFLSGNENWFYPNGLKKYTVNYESGVKTGDEIFYNSTGKKIWEWKHGPTRNIFITYWENGIKKTSSEWEGKFCDGQVMEWDNRGKLKKSLIFKKGDLDKVLIDKKN